MSTPIRGKLTKDFAPAMSINENTGHVEFTFRMHGARFRYTGKLDKKGYFVPNYQSRNDELLLKTFIKTKTESN